MDSGICIDDRFGCSGEYRHSADSSQRDFIRSRAELNAVTYADHMKADIVRGIDITNTFEQIVISENGKISMFSKVAENMMADYIQSIQIAPDGVVTEI